MKFYNQFRYLTELEEFMLSSFPNKLFSFLTEFSILPPFSSADFLAFKRLRTLSFSLKSFLDFPLTMDNFSAQLVEVKAHLVSFCCVVVQVYNNMSKLRFSTNIGNCTCSTVQWLVKGLVFG